MHINTEIENELQKLNPTHEEDNETLRLIKNIGKYSLVFFLGSGKIIGSSALLLQNVRGTLHHLKFGESIDLGASVACAISNGVTNGITRYTSIYDKLFNPAQSSIEENNLTWKQWTVAEMCKMLGRGSLIFVSLNTQTAVQDLIYYCYNINNFHKKPFSYKDDWWMTVIAGGVTLSGAVSFFAFNLKRIDANAVKFAQKMISKDIIQNIGEISRAVLIPMSLMTAINILPNMGGNYYPTKKALTNIFGADNINDWYVQTLLYSSLICGFSSNLFSMVGESFNFLTHDQKSRVKKWIRNPAVYFILVPTVIDILSNGFGGYIANLEMIQDILGKVLGNIAPIVLSILFTAISTIFYTLYQEVPAFDAVANSNCCEVYDNEDERSPSLETLDETDSPLTDDSTAQDEDPSSVTINIARQNTAAEEYRALNSNPSSFYVRTKTPLIIDENRKPNDAEWNNSSLNSMK